MTKIFHVPPEQISDKLEQLVEILQLTVNLGASIGWLAPLWTHDAIEYWRTVQSQVTAGEKSSLPRNLTLAL